MMDNNERAVLEKIRELSPSGKPLEISLREIKVEIPRKRLIRRVTKTIASHQAIRDILNRLQKKGYVTLDLSGERHKIIIN